MAGTNHEEPQYATPSASQGYTARQIASDLAWTRFTDGFIQVRNPDSDSQLSGTEVSALGFEDAARAASAWLRGDGGENQDSQTEPTQQPEDMPTEGDE